MIPLIKREIVDNHQWVSMKEFMETIAISQTTPGAVAVNTTTFVGYKMARYKGALAAIVGVSLIFSHFRSCCLFTAFFLIPLFFQPFLKEQWGGGVVALLV